MTSTGSPSTGTYDPRSFKALTFHDASTRFRDGSDNPRAYLERCLEAVTTREPIVKALVATNIAGARAVGAAHDDRHDLRPPGQGRRPYSLHRGGCHRP